MAFRERVKETIQEMEEAGIIEKSSSPYCNPFRVVIKNNDDIRLCLDTQHINQIIEDDHEAPPLITVLILKYNRANYFTKIDLTKDTGTSFLFYNNQYQHIRVTFGIKTAGSAFIRALKKLSRK